MKKFIVSLGLSFSLITGAFAGDSVVDLLNSEITTLLAPFQNDTTTAQLNFDAVETNSDHAIKVALDGLYRKTGLENIFGLKIDNLSYDYGDGTSPTTVIKGAVDIDFTKILSSKETNEMIPRAMEVLDETVKDYVEMYGDAISIKGVVTSTAKDTEGNYTGFTALVSAKVDLNKLPEEMSSDQIIVTDTVVSISLNLKTGVSQGYLLRLL